MKILVTGATGKVGSRLARRLAQRGDQVRALVRGGYQITANSDHDQGAYAEVGLLYAPSTKKSGNQEAGVWRWVLGALVGLVVIGIAAD